MGKVTVFCPISGCTPESADDLKGMFDVMDTDEEPGPRLREAIQSILTEDERRGEEDVTVVGNIDAQGRSPPFRTHFTRADVAAIPAAALRVVRGCTMGQFWDMGSVSAPEPHGETYLVSFGTLIMVQTAALDILLRATAGRVTPQRLWRLAMHCGHFETGGYGGLRGVDYGAIAECREQFPPPLPGYAGDVGRVCGLERLGEVEAIRERLVHEGMYWVWMAPDRFPLNAESDRDDALFIPCHIGPPTRATRSSAIETLPAELLHALAPSLPLPSLLAFLTTSRTIRAALLSFQPDRDALARAWILARGPWYVCPGSGAMGAMGWAYLRRCVESGSMRNRRRIWGAALDVERVADEEGV